MRTIRRIQAKDREEILELLDGTGAFQKHELTVALELIDISLNKPDQQDYLPYVLEENDQVQAYACFGKNPMTRFTYDLYWLATRRENMRHGYGRALVAFVEEEVKRQGGRMLVIETSSKEGYEGSRAFYIRLSYEFAASLPDYYDIGDNRVIYFKRLQT